MTKLTNQGKGEGNEEYDKLKKEYAETAHMGHADNSLEVKGEAPADDDTGVVVARAEKNRARTLSGVSQKESEKTYDYYYKRLKKRIEHGKRV